MLEFYFGFSLLVILSVFVFYTNSVVSSGRGLGVQINYIGVYLLGVIALLYSQSSNASLSYIANSCVKDPITIFFIVLGLLGGIAILALAVPYLQRGSLHEYEFFFVVALTLLGLILVVESNDFLSLYLGIELQSLGLYILATIKNNSTFSTEAGLKYFILGAFASILLLFGIVLFYALTGLLNFDDFLLLTVNNADLPAYYTNGILLSLVFISISLIFKIGGAPFHMWVPDVYEGATSIVTAYFSLVPKLAILSVLLRLTFLFFYGEFVELSNLFIFCSVLSCFIGALGAFGQTRIKRVLSYSAIFHSGLLLFGLSLGNFEAFVGSLFYIVIYFTLVLHIFSTVLGGQNSLNNSILKVTSNFGYLYKSNRFLGISLVIALFSLAGIPPLSGFFSKLFIFFAGIKQGYLLLSIILIMLSAGGATYYLRVIRSAMFFNKKRTWLCFNQISKGNAYLVSFLLLLNMSIVWWSSTLLYFIYNNSLIYLF